MCFCDVILTMKQRNSTKKLTTKRKFVKEKEVRKRKWLVDQLIIF